MKTLITLLALCLINVGCCADKLSCDQCGHLVLEEHIKKIMVQDEMNIKAENRTRQGSYCAKCVPAGKNAVYIYGSERRWFTVPEQEPEQKEIRDAYTCYECNHLFKPGTGKDITTANFDSEHIASGTIHFCSLCIPKYDRIVTNRWNSISLQYVKRVPPVGEKWIVVDKDGNEPAPKTIAYPEYRMTNIIWYSRFAYPEYRMTNIILYSR